MQSTVCRHPPAGVCDRSGSGGYRVHLQSKGERGKHTIGAYLLFTWPCLIRSLHSAKFTPNQQSKSVCQECTCRNLWKHHSSMFAVFSLLFSRWKTMLIVLSRMCLMTTTAPTAMPRVEPLTMSSGRWESRVPCHSSIVVVRHQPPSLTFHSVHSDSFSVVAFTITLTGGTHAGMWNPKTTVCRWAAAKVTLGAAQDPWPILNISTKK